jgi:hypothetical protein
MTNRPYRRLPGHRLLSMAGKQTLWLGDDHVLSVASTGYTEQYRRFFLRDITTIVVERTKRWMIWSIVLGSVAGVFALLALATNGIGGGSDASAVVVLLVVFVVPSLFALVVNLLRGPTCSVRIQTHVQTSEVGAVGRLRAADKLLAELAPLILAAQPVTPPPPPETSVEETSSTPAEPAA